MNDQTCLIFSSNSSLYGINTIYVEEIIPLPELTQTSDTSGSISGAFNFRGNPCLVIELGLHHNNQKQDYQLSDSVVVIKWEKSRLGIIADKVYEVKTISFEETYDNFPGHLNHVPDLVAEIEKQPFIRFIKSTENIFILNDPGNLIKSVETQQLTYSENFIKEQDLDESFSLVYQAHEKYLDSEELVFSKTANPEQRIIFQQRANDLKHSNENPVLEKLISLVVIALDGNVLGIDSAYVHEFVDISKVSPIPCCPPHIVGNMNLRGEILTLIDIRQMLELPNTILSSGSVAMVVKVEDITAGILVDEVLDAMFLLNPQSIQSASASELLSNIEYIEGTALYHHEQIISLLNLPKFFVKGGLFMGEIA